MNKSSNKRKYEHLRTTSVVPDMLTAKLPYYEYIHLFGNISSDYVFTLNSIFDPNFTGVGHQPIGHDQWAAFYNRYRVTGVDVDVECINNSIIPTTVVIQTNNSNASQNTVAAINSAREQPFSAARLLGPAGGGNVHWTYREFIPLDKVLGVSRAKLLADDTYSAVMTASPVEGVFLHVMAADLSAGTNVSVSFNVRISFHTDLFDREQLIQS